jgi:hypothetical protein
MRPFMVILSIICCVLPISCIQGDDRCGNLISDKSLGTCLRPFESTDADTGAKKDGGVADGGGDSDSDGDGDSESPPPVLGESCSSDAECAVYNANYCNLAATPPFCTLRDCTAPQNRCPAGYDCCVSPTPDWYPDHCMPSDIYEVMKEQLCIL